MSRVQQAAKSEPVAIVGRGMVADLVVAQRALVQASESMDFAPLRLDGVSRFERVALRNEARRTIDAMLDGLDAGEATALRGLTRALAEAELWREALTAQGIEVAL